MEKLQQGHERVAAVVFQRFTHQVIRLARKRLPEEIPRKVEPEDVMQSVFRSFFHRQRSGRVVCVNMDQLWRLLSTITLRKCGRRVAYLQAACRDFRREDYSMSWELRPLDGIPNRRQPSPVETVIFGEMFDYLKEGLEECDQEVLRLHLCGYLNAEISQRVQRAGRTVRRVLERIRKRLARIRAVGGEAYVRRDQHRSSPSCARLPGTMVLNHGLQNNNPRKESKGRHGTHTYADGHGAWPVFFMKSPMAVYWNAKNMALIPLSPINDFLPSIRLFMEQGK
jgi:RNA polymerase sigma-70 factor (ECF subfamily)